MGNSGLAMSSRSGAATVKDNLTVARPAKVAAKKVDAEYDRWHTRAINAPSPVEQHFVEVIGKVKQIEAAKPKVSRKRKGDQA